MTKKNTKAPEKSNVKTLPLERETIKDLSAGDKKKIKGGGGAASGVMMGRYQQPL